MFIRIIKAKWHVYLGVVSFCMLYATFFIYYCLNQVPIASTTGSALWLLNGILVFIIYYRQDLEQENNQESNQPIEIYRNLHNFKKFSKYSAAEKIFSTVASILIFIFTLSALYSAFFISNRNYSLDSVEYDSLTKIANILLPLVLGIDYLRYLLKIKSKILNPIIILLLISGLILIIAPNNFITSYLN